MDRDIEDGLGYVLNDGSPADRGDATQADPAVIEAMNAVIQDALSGDEFCGPWCNSKRSMHIQVARLVRRLVPSLAEAAAGVIAPATAEQIAAAIEKRASRQHIWLRDGMQRAASIVRRDFAAGLSAGATGGGSDE